MIGSFSESSRVANAYREELLGLMAINLILLSVDKVHGGTARSVEVVSDCLGALRRVTDLPPYQIPSRCKHSNILKNILVHCHAMTFMIHYWHVRAHQDNLGEERLAAEDRFLLECNFDGLATTNGEQQEYWILAIQAAREACRLCATARALTQRSGYGTTDG